MDNEKMLNTVKEHNSLLERADDIFYYIRQKLEEKYGENEASAILDDIQEVNCCFFIDVDRLKKYL